MKTDRTKVTELIRSYIKLNGPQSIGQLVRALEISDHHVRAAVNADASLVSAGRRQFGQVYGLAGIHAPKPKELPKAYKYEFKELTPHDHDIYAGRTLALLGR